MAAERSCTMALRISSALSATDGMTTRYSTEPVEDRPPDDRSVARQLPYRRRIPQRAPNDPRVTRAHVGSMRFDRPLASMLHASSPKTIVSGGLTDVDRPVRTKAKSLRGGVLLSLCGGAEVAQANLFRASLNSDRGLRCL